MAATVYVGIATTSHNATLATKAVLTNLKVTAAAAPQNQLPVVSVTSPTNGAAYAAPASFTLSATASDPDGTIAKVELYSGSTLAATFTTAPYSLSASSVPAGTYSFTAVAYDNTGAKVTSAPCTITVGTTSGNKPPTVSLTAPAGGATYTAPASIALTASAADSDGTISKVEFYRGTTLLGTDTTAPYSVSSGSLAAGTYSLTAVAYDNAGAKTTSAAVSITVGTTTTTAPTAVVFHASTDNATVTSYRFDVFASGANPATAAPVSTTNLGKPAMDANGDITSNQSTLFNALPVGSYQATVTAISSGGSTRSAPVAFTR